MGDLLDFIDTYSEEYRHQCECRFIATLPLANRRKYLEDIQTKRGIAEKLRIQQTLTEIWKNKKLGKM